MRQQHYHSSVERETEAHLDQRNPRTLLGPTGMYSYEEPVTRNRRRLRTWLSFSGTLSTSLSAQEIVNTKMLYCLKSKGLIASVSWVTGYDVRQMWAGWAEKECREVGRQGEEGRCDLWALMMCLHSVAAAILSTAAHV